MGERSSEWVRAPVFRLYFSTSVTIEFGTIMINNSRYYYLFLFYTPLRAISVGFTVAMLKVARSRPRASAQSALLCGEGIAQSDS